MEAEEKVRVMREFYTNFMEETLRAVFQNDKKAKVAYNAATAARREEIDGEIRKQAREIGSEIVEGLREAGFPSGDPSPEDIRKVVKKVLKERGVNTAE